MVWKKIVQVTAVSACPKLREWSLHFEPDSNLDDPQANV
jgi:hypothetical protein